MLYIEDIRAFLRISRLQLLHQNRIEYNNIGVRALSGPMYLDLNNRPSVPHIVYHRSPAPLAKFQMAPMPSSLMSSGSKKKEPK